MIKTETLQLPIYNTPDVDTFNLTDINTAHTNLEAFANEFINNPNILIEREVVNARGSEISLDDRLDKIDTSINGLQIGEIFTTSEKSKLSGISSGANKVTGSIINGNILIDGVETNVYSHKVKDYIYKAGDTCDILTGGYGYWKFSPEDIGASNDGTKITMEYGTGDTSATTVNSIDLTDYAKLYVDLEYVATNGTNIYGAIVIGYRRVWDVLFGSGYSRRIVEIDISNIVDLQTISFFGDGRGNARGRFNVYNAWLEQDGEILTTTEKNKLSGIANNANNYVHPTNHAPSIITQDVNNRFVTDVEKATWNGKATQSTIDTSINAIKIGGRNLISRYAELPNMMVATTGLFTAQTGSSLMVDYIPVVVGESLVFSQIFSGTGDNYFRYAFYQSDKTTLVRRTVMDIALFYDTVPANSAWMRVSYCTSNAVKLEKGNKATGWIPAIEDMAYKITNGTTRPTPTHIGQVHFDTKPIWCKTISPPVWVDSTGTVV